MSGTRQRGWRRCRRWRPADGTPKWTTYISASIWRTWPSAIGVKCLVGWWEHQPEGRSGAWRGTIRAQRRELRQLLESGTLRKHAESVLADAYAEARRQAADETELSLDLFPVEDARDLDELLAEPDRDRRAA